MGIKFKQNRTRITPFFDPDMGNDSAVAHFKMKPMSGKAMTRIFNEVRRTDPSKVVKDIYKAAEPIEEKLRDALVTEQAKKEFKESYELVDELIPEPDESHTDKERSEIINKRRLLHKCLNPPVNTDGFMRYQNDTAKRIIDLIEANPDKYDWLEMREYEVLPNEFDKYCIDTVKDELFFENPFDTENPIMVCKGNFKNIPKEVKEAIGEIEGKNIQKWTDLVRDHIKIGVMLRTYFDPHGGQSDLFLSSLGLSLEKLSMAAELKAIHRLPGGWLEKVKELFDFSNLNAGGLV